MKKKVFHFFKEFKSAFVLAWQEQKAYLIFSALFLLSLMGFGIVEQFKLQTIRPYSFAVLAILGITWMISKVADWSKILLFFIEKKKDN